VELASMNTNRLVIEEAKVSIISVDTPHGAVRIALPVALPRGDLGFVLQGLGMRLILEDRKSDSNGNGAAGNGVPANGAASFAEHAKRFGGLEIAEPQAQSPQRDDRRTKSDRRGLPRRKVVKRNRSGKREELSCGHVIEPVPTNWKKHKSRACEACAEA
jgi:hypothetical protein